MNDNPAPKRPSIFGRAITLLVSTLFAIIVVTTVVILFPRQKSRIVTLPDGNQLEVLGVAPTGVRFTTEQFWHPFARKILPARYKHWIPNPIVALYSSGITNGLVVYARIVPPRSGVTNITSNGPNIWAAMPSSQPVSGSFNILTWSTTVAEDNAGFRYEPRPPRMPRDAAILRIEKKNPAAPFTPLPASCVTLLLPTYPRREKEFPVHLLDFQGKDMAVLRVHNPYPPVIAKWKSVPLPQSVSNGPVKLTLQSLQQRGIAAKPYLAPPVWKIESTDPDWAVGGITMDLFQDATGNTAPFLSPREPVWKLHTLVIRQDNANFSPSEQAVLTNLPVPPAIGGFTSLSQRASSTLISVQAINIVINEPARSFLLVETSDYRPDEEIVFRLVDNLGRKLDAYKQSETHTAGGKLSFVVVFSPLPDTKTINLHAILNRPLYFDFFINPKDIKPSID